MVVVSRANGDVGIKAVDSGASGLMCEPKYQQLSSSIRQGISVLAVTGALSSVVFAQGFPLDGVIELSSLNTNDPDVEGVVFNGIDSGDGSGVSISTAGDINSDGIDDLIIGAFDADPNASGSGESYVIFGGNTLLGEIELSNLNATVGESINGIVINGIDLFDLSGYSVSGVGDVNNDGRDDLLIGAPDSDSEVVNSGESYVVFGNSDLNAVIELSALNSAGAGGANGVLIKGIGEFDRSGSTVSRAGDIDGDGIDDLVIGARNADPNGIESGASYIIFGGSDLPEILELSALNTTGSGSARGLIINGFGTFSLSGSAASGVGDVNADGVDDLLIGAPGNEVIGTGVGQSYLIFGGGHLSGVIELSALNAVGPGAVAGVLINGANVHDRFGTSVSGGDLNGDDISDLFIGASNADQNGMSSGVSYVIFGDSGLPDVIELSALNTLANGAADGLVINGVEAYDVSGISLANAGDINSDGIDDLLIGAPDADPNGASTGESYVIFGDYHLPEIIELSALNSKGSGTPSGLIINGVDIDDRSGIRVSGAKDINGDGIDDLMIGVYNADPNGSGSGETYVIFGQPPEVLFEDGFE